MTSIAVDRVLCVALTPVYQRTLEFDPLKLGEVNRARRVQISGAGKGPNVALALHNLGGHPIITGFLGGDTGTYVQQFFAQRNILCRWTSVQAPTRICQTLIDRATGTITELVEEAQIPSDEEWAAFRKDYHRVLAEGCRMLALAGTLIPGAPSDFYRELAQSAREADVPVVIDSHKEPLLLALEAKPWMAKLNAYELGLTLKREIDSDKTLVDAAHELLERGAQSVCVTQGARAAWLIVPDCTYRFTPPKIHPINPIGSGDSVTAGIIQGHLTGKSRCDAMALGLACGTANALTHLPAHFDLQDVERLLPLVSVE